jgi:hypothetical protein
MKIVTWTRDSAPELDIDDNGDYIFEDRAIWYNLRVGDLIQYRSLQQGIGTRCYLVTDVCPLAEEEYSKINLVCIEEQ